ncbi:MAG: DNA recombination protein RmuC [Spirochaetales bacterium]|jgi:DNA recombination protein RmuC|nr:DNA recombination protein RmuC [Spirochaetales bacterium]
MSRNLSAEEIAIAILGAALGAALIVLVILTIVLIRRGLGRNGQPRDLQELVGRRLEQIDILTRDMNALTQMFLVPHTRGGLGETLLNELLKNWLPEKSYKLQHTFVNGARVDAVIRLGEYLVPVDAKFPLESIRRSMEANPTGGVVTAEVRRTFMKHGEAIRSKYIRPEEGTLQFALMYVPSERVYYHGFIESDSGLLEDLLQMGVVPVSPGGLFLYLQTVAYGLRGLAFSRRQRELIQITLNLKREVENLKRLYHTGNAHLRNLTKNREEADKKLIDVAQILERIDITAEDE